MATVKKQFSQQSSHKKVKSHSPTQMKIKKNQKTKPSSKEIMKIIITVNQNRPGIWRVIGMDNM